MIRCADCTLLNSTNEADLRQGLGTCQKKPRHESLVSVSYPRDCKSFAPAAAGTGDAMITRINTYWSNVTNKLGRSAQ